MAPANNPKYVVVVMVEQGGHGATTAAPIVRRILEGLFGLQTGGLIAGQFVD
jgi:penicillin-binding protein 2